MPILAGDQLDVAAAMLREGRVVAMPTETVYGLAADAMNLSAVARVFQIKDRPRFDPLIVHVATPEAAWALAAEVPVEARTLAEAFWPGPLTLVLPKIPGVDDLVTAGLPTVALRVPGHELGRRLIEAVGSPLAAPSANRFGSVSPTSPRHVLDDLGEDIPVLDGGPCARGLESTVVGFTEGSPCVLRLGSLTVESLEQVLGIQVIIAAATDRPQAVSAPGRLSRHYAPRTPLRLVEAWPARPGKGAGALAFADLPSGYEWVERLSAAGDVVEAAANLFGAMRKLDAAGLERIDARLLPEQGLGRAINDRLRRAAAPAGGGE